MSEFGKRNHEDQQRRACARPQRTAHSVVTGRRPRGTCRRGVSRRPLAVDVRRRLGLKRQPMKTMPASPNRPRTTAPERDKAQCIRSRDCSSSFADEATGRSTIAWGATGRQIQDGIGQIGAWVGEPPVPSSFLGLACIPDLADEIHLDKRVARAPARATRLFRRT